MNFVLKWSFQLKIILAPQHASYTDKVTRVIRDVLTDPFAQCYAPCNKGAIRDLLRR